MDDSDKNLIKGFNEKLVRVTEDPSQFSAFEVYSMLGELLSINSILLSVARELSVKQNQMC